MSESTYETVSYNCNEGICTILLDRPDCLNAMNAALIVEVAQAFADANADPDTRVIIFSGTGRAFCVGDDRNEHQHPESESEAREFVESIQQATREIVFGSKPVVGAIHGWAVGGGFEWALNCDFTVWGESSRAFFPEVSLNLCVTGAATAILPAMVGLNKAREMLFLGDKYTATELLEMGIATLVVADNDVMSEAETLAKRLAGLPVGSIQAMKRNLNQVGIASLEAALRVETDACVAGFMDPETTRLLKNF